MSFRLLFSGEIKKPNLRQAAGKDVLEFSLCQKNYSREGVAPTFTWVNVVIWEPKQFLIDQAVVGAFVSGIGKMELGSYEKDGAKIPKITVKASGFDVDFARAGAHREDSANDIAPASSRPALGSGSDEEIPF